MVQPLTPWVPVNCRAASSLRPHYPHPDNAHDNTRDNARDNARDNVIGAPEGRVQC